MFFVKEEHSLFTIFPILDEKEALFREKRKRFYKISLTLPLGSVKIYLSVQSDKRKDGDKYVSPILSESRRWVQGGKKKGFRNTLPSGFPEGDLIGREGRVRPITRRDEFP